MTETSTDGAKRVPAKRLRPYFKQPLFNLFAYISALLAASAFVFSYHVSFIYFAVFFLASAWYGTVSHWMTVDGVHNVDAIVTSEIIITCGIASLILHVAVAGAYVDAELASAQGFSEQTVRVAARTFSEGLVCAAVAPVIAMVLRFIEGRERARGPSIDSPEEVARILEDFARRSSSMARSMARLSSAIDSSAENYEGAAVRVSTALEELATGVQSKSRLVLAELTEMEAKTKACADALSAASAALEKIGTDASGAFSSTTDSLKKLSTQLEEFTGKVRVSSQLLDALRELIASVNRFIRPDADGTAKGP